MSKPSEIQIAYSKLMESMEGMAKDAKGWKASDISAVTGMTGAIRNLKSENSIAQARIVELEADIRKIHNIVGVQSEQGACWDDKVAFEHSEAVLKVFEISSKALKGKS